MFRALASIHEKKDTTEKFINGSEFLTKQTDYAKNKLPVMLITDGILSDTKSNLKPEEPAFRTWEPNTRQSSLRNVDIGSYTVPLYTKDQLLKMQEDCKSSSIDSLINTTNLKSNVRCGWIYEKGSRGDQPKVSSGFLGTKEGPASSLVNSVPKGKWYWDLDEAKKNILGDRCNALTSCSYVGSTNYANCAYSKTKGIGVPIDQNGNLLYPNDIALSAPPSSLITNSANCPLPPAPGTPQYELARSRDVCMPLPDGKLSRDCVLEQVKVAGCERDGALYKALLNESTPNNYAVGLDNLLSFKKYQELASNPLMDSVIRTGKATRDLALGNFKALSKESSVVKNTPLNYAARDLCIATGQMDQYDFCDDMKGTSKAPYPLDCLQKAWKKAGGQSSGTAYPTSQNKGTYDSYYSTWDAYLNSLKKVSSNCKSNDANTQKTALTEFLGIKSAPVSKSQINRMPGSEVLWFNNANNSFIGRRISVNNPQFPTFYTSGNVENTGLSSFVEYYTTVNIRPPSDMKIRIAIATDDGTVYALNRTINAKGTRYRPENNDTIIAANWDQPPTIYIGYSCWSLVANGPNYINGYWQQTGGESFSKIVYSPCDKLEWKEFPSSWITLTQEPKAPVFSWEVNPNIYGFMERRFPHAMEIILNGNSKAISNTTNMNYSSVLQMTNRSSGIITRNISMNSWRTLTISFRNNSNTNGILLTFGPLTIRTEGSNVNFYWNSASLNVSYSCTNVCPPNSDKACYIMVNMRSLYDNTYPTVLGLYAGMFGSMNKSSIITYTTNNNQPLYNSTDSSSIVLGDKNMNASSSVDIGSLRLYDYELFPEEVAIDQANTWQMSYLT
jgi:hypothetical protein